MRRPTRVEATLKRPRLRVSSLSHSLTYPPAPQAPAGSRPLGENPVARGETRTKGEVEGPDHNGVRLDRAGQGR